MAETEDEGRLYGDDSIELVRRRWEVMRRTEAYRAAYGSGDGTPEVLRRFGFRDDQNLKLLDPESPFEELYPGLATDPPPRQALVWVARTFAWQGVVTASATAGSSVLTIQVDLARVRSVGAASAEVVKVLRRFYKAYHLRDTKPPKVGGAFNTILRVGDLHRTHPDLSVHEIACRVYPVEMQQRSRGGRVKKAAQRLVRRHLETYDRLTADDGWQRLTYP